MMKDYYHKLPGMTVVPDEGLMNKALSKMNDAADKSLDPDAVKKYLNE